MADNYAPFVRPYNLFVLGDEFLDCILYGGSIKGGLARLRKCGKDLICKSSLAENADDLLNVFKAKSLVVNAENGFTEISESLSREMWKHYDVMQDDFFIIAAFENWAKAKLLSKGYFVHQVNSPNCIGKLQKRKPIHYRTIRKYIQAESLKVNHFTLGLNVIVNDNYCSVLGFSEDEIYCISRFKRIRNAIHFGGPNHWGFNEQLLRGLIGVRNRIKSDA